MKVSGKVFVPAWILAAFVLPGSGAPTAQETQVSVPFSKILPKNCLVYLSLRSPNQLGKRLEAAGLKAFLQEPEVQEFAAYLGGLWEKFERENPVADKLPQLKAKEFLDVLEGELCLAWADPGREILLQTIKKREKVPPKELLESFFLLVDAKGKADALEALLKRIVDASFEGKKTEESYKGCTLVNLTQVGKDKEGTFSYCRSGSWFGFSMGPEGLKSLIRRSKDGTGDDLASHPEFAAFQRAAGPEMDMSFYLNAGGLSKLALEAIRQELPASRPTQPGRPAGPDPKQMGLLLDRLWNERSGLGSLGIFALGAGAADQRISTRFYLSTPEGAKGLLQALMAAGPSAKVPDFVPEDTHQFGAMRFDFAAGYQALKGIVTDIFEMQGQKQMDPEAMVQMMTGINLKELREKVFDNLTGEYISFGKIPRPFPPLDEMDDGTVHVLPVKDEAKLLEGIRNLFGALSARNPDLDPEEEDYLGSKLFSFEGFCLAVKNGRLVLGSPDFAKAALRRMGGSEKTLADNPAFQELSRELPSNYQGLQFSNTDQMELLVHLVRSGEFQKFFSMIRSRRYGVEEGETNGTPRREVGGFDFSKIPSPELLGKHFLGAIGYTAVTPQGWAGASVWKVKKPK